MTPEPERVDDTGTPEEPRPRRTRRTIARDLLQLLLLNAERDEWLDRWLPISHATRAVFRISTPQKRSVIRNLSYRLGLLASDEHGRILLCAWNDQTGWDRFQGAHDAGNRRVIMGWKLCTDRLTDPPGYALDRPYIARLLNNNFRAAARIGSRTDRFAVGMGRVPQETAARMLRAVERVTGITRAELPGWAAGQDPLFETEP
jgi:hypothetical protein